MNSKAWQRAAHILVVVSTLAILLAPPLAQARDRGWEGLTPGQAAERLADRLELTGEQRGRVLEVMEQRFAEHRELREAHRQEMRTFRAQTAEELAQVLTAVQLDQWRTLGTSRKGRCRDCDRWGMRCKQE